MNEAESAELAKVEAAGTVERRATMLLTLPGRSPILLRYQFILRRICYGFAG